MPRGFYSNQKGQPPLVQKFLRSGIALNVAALAGLSTYTVLTQPVPVWTAFIILLCNLIAIIGTALLFRLPNDIFFSPITVLVGGLVAGRLLSTVWLIAKGSPPPDVTPLVLGETGPGVAGAMPITLLLVVLLAAFFVTTALTPTQGSSERLDLTPSDPSLGNTQLYPSEK